MEPVNKNILYLDKISKKNREAVKKDVNDVLSLMQSNEKAAEIKVLKEIGLDFHIREAEKAEQDIKRFDVLEKKFGRKVYSAKQVKEYCESFGYRILRVDHFRHEVPIKVGEEILKFIEDNSYDHQANENRIVRNSHVNKGAAYFFLLTSIQSMNGAPIKHATLFYREDYNNTDYHKIKEQDMLIEVASWGVKGNEQPLLWYYLIDNPATLFVTAILMLFSLILILCGIETLHIFLPIFVVINLITGFMDFKTDFFTWNSN